MKFARTIRLTLLLCSAVAATLILLDHALNTECLFISNATSLISTGDLPNLEDGGFAFWVPLLAMVLSIAWVSVARKQEWWLVGDLVLASLIAVSFLGLWYQRSNFGIGHGIMGFPLYAMLCGLLVIDLRITSKLRNRPRGRAGVGH